MGPEAGEPTLSGVGGGDGALMATAIEMRESIVARCSSDP